MLSKDTVAFLCANGGQILDAAYPEVLGDAVRVPIPCASRLDVVHVLRAVEQGARRVLVVACPAGNCRSMVGPDEAERRLHRAAALLREAGSHAQCILARAAANAPEDLRSTLAASLEDAANQIEEAPA